MRQETIEIFKFEELDEEAKERALDEIRELRYADAFTVDRISDVIHGMLEERGIEIEDLTWDFTRRSNMDFNSTDIDIKKLLKFYDSYEEFEGMERFAMASISKTHLGGGSYNTDIEIEFLEAVGDIANIIAEEKRDDFYDTVYSLLEKAIKAAKESGREELEYIYSDDGIKDFIEQQDIEFEKSGKPWW